MLSYEEYELNGQCSVNYQKYIGKWGIFTDYISGLEDAFIGVLKEVRRYKGNVGFVVNTQDGEFEMKRFILFTEDMLERLSLK